MEGGRIPFFNLNDDPTNAGDRWKKWIARFENFLTASDINNVERQKALLLHYAGEDVFEIFHNLPKLTTTTKERVDEKGARTRVEMDCFEIAKQKLSNYFSPKTNIEFEIFSFRQAKQIPNETVGQFYARLLKLSSNCEFSDRDKEIKSQIICTTTSHRLRDFAFQTKPTLQKLLEEAKTIEMSEEHAIKIEAQQQHTTEQCNHVARAKQHYNTKRTNTNTNPNKKSAQTQKHSNNNPNCKNCGNNWHSGGLQQCPARNILCNFCKKKGHFAKVCMKPKSSNNFKINNLQQTENDETQDSVFTINDATNNNLPTITVSINKTPTNFTIDTGSTATIISNSTFNKLTNRPTLTKHTGKIIPYNSTTSLPIIGKFTASLTFKQHSIAETIYVIDSQAISILSYNASKQLNIIHIVQQLSNNISLDIKQKYPEVFRGIGKHNKHKVHLFIDKEVPPVAQRFRRIPFHLRSSVEDEINRLLKADIIEKATGPTPWVSPVVIVPKPHNPTAIRMCIDMRAANKAIQRVRKITPTLQDIITSLNGTTVYSKIDLNEGYHQIELDEESRFITTFSTHCGVYRYKRLNFGVNTAAEEFQDIIRQTLNNIKNVLNVSDDIFIFGKTQTEHDQALEEVFQRLRANNLTVNEKKCVFSQPQLKFFGFVFSKDGIQPDPEKVAVFEQLKTPNNVSEVRSILGMLNFALPFLPELATHTQPLRELIQKNTEFVWKKKHEEALIFLKKLMGDASKLAYYDMNKPTHLHVDAGPEGLSGILSQHHNKRYEIVAYASHALTAVEKRYSQIEKEMLAATWAMEHFKIYLYGTKFTLHTDHMPLISIFKNPLSKPTSRIERLLLKTQEFSFNIQHQQGNSNPADYFSRHPNNNSNNSYNKNNIIEQYVNFIINNSLPKAISLQTIQEETQQDPILQLLIKAITSNSNTQWNSNQISRYKGVRQELSIAEGCVLKGSQILLPHKLVQRAIALAHKSHMGIVKTKQLLRTKIWFPDLDKKVEETVSQCHICQVVNNQNHREPLSIVELASTPFEKVSMDFAGPLPNGKYLLILVDEYSKYPFVEQIHSTKFIDVKKVLTKIFSAFGTPLNLKSDNGPPFSSHEFKEFMDSQNIKHHKTTPYWPEANGAAERMVKTIKKSLISSELEHHNCLSQLDMFLMDYRSTPQATTEVSPFELMFNRKMNNFLPTLKEKTTKLVNKEQNNKLKNKQYADKRRHTKRAAFKVGDQVICKQRKINKLTPPYDPEPMKITKIIGSQIWARREGETNTIVRNSSFFKNFVKPNIQQITTRRPARKNYINYKEQNQIDSNSNENSENYQQFPTPADFDIAIDENNRDVTEEVEVFTTPPNSPQLRYEHKRSTRSKRPLRFDDYILE
ncbi:uncharacterized protein K02A2.6-like [Episyrphus balteatus]|uniref:uncharacterized protein K02A2.6-like n=1 Tax=Episyrphus balteatus TaxID=286459 RepID=UPI00248521CF|nr:uncharacterized protein K02A2.6-like [Episyrphus balteatus]